jgi:hypothetical protein
MLAVAISPHGLIAIRLNEATLSQELCTVGLLQPHILVEYQWQNIGLCHEDSSTTGALATSCRNFPKTSSRVEILAVREIISHSARSPGSSFFRWFASQFMVLVSSLFLLIRSLIVSRTALAVENLALRQQLAVLNRKIHRRQLHRRDRFFWVIFSQLWKNWREVLIIVKPETVIKWHRQGFKLYWRWKSKAPVGRPKIDREIRELIKRMSLENSL